MPQRAPRRTVKPAGNALLRHFRVGRPAAGSNPSRGKILAGALVLPCALGKTGIKARKREGDHASPLGTYRLLGGFFRADRMPRPRSLVPLRVLRPDMGWCDDTRSFLYNRPMRLPAKVKSKLSHEVLWREDHLYDLMIILDHNQCPRVRGHGSAIFLHCARPDFVPTEGCIALPLPVLRKLLPRLSRGCTLRIGR
ncbi:L,D-transpeptidase family protein [Beijerinckia indica]|nr:L,D-transpeptidase family protein [Beijerinckia indica]